MSSIKAHVFIPELFEGFTVDLDSKLTLDKFIERLGIIKQNALGPYAEMAQHKDFGLNVSIEAPNVQGRVTFTINAGGNK